MPQITKALAIAAALVFRSIKERFAKCWNFSS